MMHVNIANWQPFSKPIILRHETEALLRYHGNNFAGVVGNFMNFGMLLWGSFFWCCIQIHDLLLERLFRKFNSIPM